VIRFLSFQASEWSKHIRILQALVFREATTRYGRDNIGLLWIIGEPAIFAIGVLIMWSFIRPPYDHGIRLLPFLMTGYLPLLLMRHMVSQGIGTALVNANLLYHRQITILHLFIARAIMEFIGNSMSTMVIVSVSVMLGLLDPPKSVSTIINGWFLLAYMSFGLTMILGSIVGINEMFEKFANLITYVLIPVSGAFYMVDWVPYQYRELVLKLPFVNAMEMIRSGFFGDTYPTYFHAGYAVMSATVMVFAGLVIMQFVRNRVQLE